VSNSNIDIKSLTPQERLALLEEIWDSLEPEDVPVTDAQRRELDRRLDDLERDRDLGIPWVEVLRQIRERPR
jgi:putative addiction module component (TIGR02574 family)